MNWFPFVLLGGIPMTAGLIAWDLAMTISEQRYEPRDWAYWVLPGATYMLLFHLVAHLISSTGSLLLPEFRYGSYADGIAFAHGGFIAGRLTGRLEFPLACGVKLSQFTLTVFTLATMTPWAYVVPNLDRLRFFVIVASGATLFFSILNRFEAWERRVNSGGAQK